MSTRKVDPEQQSHPTSVAVVKKYANRRLYNTATSSYVTLDELSQMVREGEDFVVFDAKTGEDITRSVLTQIILEEDSKGRNLLPIGFLRQLIGFYDDSLHAFLPRYLELSMENFARNQDQMRGYIEETFGRFFPLDPVRGHGAPEHGAVPARGQHVPPAQSGDGGGRHERDGAPKSAARRGRRQAGRPGRRDARAARRRSRAAAAAPDSSRCSRRRGLAQPRGSAIPRVRSSRRPARSLIWLLQ